MAASNWRKWAFRSLAAIAAPFLIAIYLRLLAFFVDWLSPYHPHTRLLLWAHYIGLGLRLLATSPALVAAVVVAGLIVFRDFFRSFLDRVESFAIGKLLEAKLKAPAHLTPGVPVQVTTPSSASNAPIEPVATPAAIKEDEGSR